jgi:hypothetical protein
MNTIYRFTHAGWVKVRSCRSFQHACRLARYLTASTGFEHCVNTP